MDETLVFAVLAFALVMFVWGKWRYDIVALASLLILAVLGIVPPAQAFLGFGHPAVVTVAAVLILSRALYKSGVVDVIASWSLRIPSYIPLRISSLASFGAFLSAFHEQRGSREFAHACCDAGCGKEQTPAVALPDAFSLCVASRRHDNADWDPAEYHRIQLPNGREWRAFQHV